MTRKTLPQGCPGCKQSLKVTRLACEECGTAVEGQFDLPVLARLDDEEQALVMSFLRSSGSLKELTRLYGVSYPTVRNRLDALIERINRLEANTAELEGSG